MFRLPGYKIGAKVGEGGISEVFEAWQEADQRKVAVKVALPRYSQDFMLQTRLLREAKIISSLHHRNLVRIYKFGTHQDRFYSVMDFLGGGDLSDFKRFGPKNLLKILIQICDGLSFIHSKNIIHRDLKPSNVLFGFDGIPRLVDFGISLFGEEDHTRLTQTNLVMGTLCYMSPEQQASPKLVDARSDIYSMGAMMYEFFTGAKPVGRFLDPSQIQAHISKDVEKVILRCLATSPDKRYGSAESLQSDLLILWESPLFGGEENEPQVGFDERIGYWLQKWREGTSREKLEARHELIRAVKPEDAARIQALFKDSGNEDRLVLIPMLAEIGHADSVPDLANCLEHHILGRDAAQALGKIGSERATQALTLLAKSKLSHADAALIPLAICAGQKAEKTLIQALKHRESRHRKQAIEALCLIPSNKVKKELKGLLKQPLDTNQRQKIQTIIGA